MTDKTLKAFIGMIAFATILLLAPQSLHAQSLAAQLSDKEIPVSEFSSINVSNDFEVSLARGAYGVRLTVDKTLQPYVEVYVKAKTLYLSFDEKAVPKDIRKMYKGKGSLTPVFRAIVYTPEIKSVTLNDNASFIGVDEFLCPDFELTAAGKTQVKNLAVTATTVKVALKKNAQAILSVKSDRGVEVSTDGNANLKLTYSGNELAVNSDGSSVVVANGPCHAMNLFTSGSSQVSVTSETEKVDLTCEGSSKIVLSGKGEVLTVKGSRSSNVDAYAMPFNEVDANLANSSSVTVSVSRMINATLVGGSSLYYSGTPEFHIGKIVKSTLAPYGTK